MKPKDEFYKIEALISKVDVDEKLKNIIPENRSKSSIVFNVLENNGIKVYEISVHSASTALRPNFANVKLH